MKIKKRDNKMVKCDLCEHEIKTNDQVHNLYEMAVHRLIIHENQCKIEILAELYNKQKKRG